VKTFLADTQIAVAVPLLRNGEPFVPDNGQVNWELRGQNGAVISPASSLTGIQNTFVTVTIGANLGELGDDRTREKRTLVITGLDAGTPFRTQYAYQLTAFVNMTATPADVRTFLGIGENELPDAEIDLLGAYLDLCDRATPAVVDTALAAGDASERAANKAIVAQAVLDLLPSLPTRYAKRETDGTQEHERFALDLERIEARALVDVERFIETSVTAAAPAVIRFAVRTDPLTGA
jgi:hypothetical protein